jgi:hypothetical protein
MTAPFHKPKKSAYFRQPAFASEQGAEIKCLCGQAMAQIAKSVYSVVLKCSNPSCQIETNLTMKESSPALFQKLKKKGS